MSETAGERALNPDQQEDVRQRVRAAMDAEGMTQSSIARLSGVAYSTFSAWMSGSYTGNSGRIGEQLERWLSSREAHKRTRAASAPGPAFLPTDAANAFFGAFEHAQHMPDLVMITGGPGVGKTTASKEYLARTTNVWLLTGEPAFGTPHVLLDVLAEELDVSERSSTRMSRAIVRRLRGTEGLVIIDEAQHLSTKTLDQLRTIHDLAEIGVALVGNETVYSRVQGVGRTPGFAQLFSRVGLRITRARPNAADIAALLDGWKIDDPAQRKLLTMIAKKPGALRNVAKCLRLAHLYALGDGGALSEETIRRAWRRLEHDGGMLEAAA